MPTEITPEARRRIAAATGASDPYLYQCLTGRKEMSALEAARLEVATGGELKRWHLCRKTWHRIWPELIGRKGAPEVAP